MIKDTGKTRMTAEGEVVSLHTAKKLRKAGFDIEVVGSYDLASNGQFMRCMTGKKWNYNEHEFTVSAPTLKEAASWLESVHNIKVSAYADGYEQMQGIMGTYNGRRLWCAKIEELDKPKEERFGIIWETYYSESGALDAAIYKACQIILDDFEIYLDE